MAQYYVRLELSEWLGPAIDAGPAKTHLNNCQRRGRLLRTALGHKRIHWAIVKDGWMLIACGASEPKAVARRLTG